MAKTPKRRLTARNPAFRKTGRLHMRADSIELKAWQDAADAAHKDLSQWVRDSLNATAKRELSGGAG